MKSERWAKLDELFHTALELPQGERSRFLARNSAGDPELVSEVAAMLAVADDSSELDLEKELRQASEAQPGSLDSSNERRTSEPSSPVPGTADPTRVAADPSEGEALVMGTVLGPYRVVELLGRGGTAEVYRAERSDSQFEQQVAIKVLLPHLQTGALAERLRLERQILARLNHPNIASLLDGGVLEDGRPYLVMEYIDGQPILEYCNRNRLSIEKRLDVFRVVCRAVHYAHLNLIAHRDLKPSNIMVGTDGEVRLLDFGIAKVLSPEHDGALVSPETQTMNRMLTPQYASPEQILGQSITTSTDIYSLGLVLFELLTGQQPQRSAASGTASLAPWLETDDPPRPSSFIRIKGRSFEREFVNRVATQRRTVPNRLRRDLTGDLDHIVLKCIRRDPAMRYSSADALAEDIRRSQTGLPVLATAGSFVYRARKLIGRNKLVVAAAVAATLSLLSFTVATALQSRVVVRERDAAREERDRANEVTTLLVDLFGADPYAQPNGEEPTVREFLDRSERELKASLTDQPALKASLLNLLGHLQGELGALDRARELADEALVIRTTLYGTSHPEVADSLNTLGSALQGLGEFEKAEVALRRALAIRAEAYGPEHLAVAESLNNLMVLLNYARRGSLEEQEKLARESLAIKRRLLGADSLEVAQSANNLAAFLYGRQEPGDAEQAETYYREALQTRRRILGDQHPRVATSMNNLAELLRSQGRLDEAESLFREAIDIFSSALDPDHPLVGSSLYGLGNLLEDRGDLAGAERALSRSLAIDRKTLPSDHPYIADGQVVLGRIFLAMERPQEAVSCFREAVGIRTSRLGQDHIETLLAQVDLADSLQQSGQAGALKILMAEVRAIIAAATGLDESQSRHVLDQLPIEN